MRNKTRLMGILNVTPDSFSDGGLFFNHEKAVTRGIKLEDDGADIIDIGGESTRPGAASVPFEEEVRRVIPVIEALANRVKIPISVDTYKSGVARLALEAGASIINDVSALRFDAEMVHVASKHHVPVVLMHMLGNPGNMQTNPVYDDVVNDVFNFLSERVAYATNNGISKDKIIVDPGICFGKSLAHNLLLIKRLDIFKNLGCRLLVGPSRKSFIGTVLNQAIEGRLEGTAAVVAVAIMKGADIIRVHDVKEMRQVVEMVNAIEGYEFH
ncbi:MAG: dihydropteroate synthase [Nitrospirae bacterium]|nr:dihydropteroate synthase [Nitrospirota bacterium]